MSDATSTFQHWRLETDADGIAWLCADRAGSSTNVLSRAVLEELARILDGLEAAPPAGVVLYSGKAQGFVAGADIDEFPQFQTAEQVYQLTRQGHELFRRIETLRCATVVVMNGFALGGGLELALACDWRLAFEGWQRTLGLPEVKLGLHPGLGGTVRLVNLVGVREAMPIMLAGKSVTPQQARRMGLVDALVTADDWRATAVRYARRPAPVRRPPILDRLLSTAPLRPLLARTLAANVARQARRNFYPAPFAMLDLWRGHGARGPEAYDAEARSFSELAVGPTSKNLVRVYGLQERLKHTGGDKRDVATHVHVVGAGVMGGDIAAWCALRGLSVTLQDREMQYIQPALDRARKLFERRLRGPGEAAAAMSRLVADVTGEGAGDAEIIIEAIFEDQDAKQALYRDLEPRMTGQAILATNTSSIPIEDLAPCLRHPERLVGLHFFNPVAKLPLIEVVAGNNTGAAAASIASAFSRQIGKLPLPCRSLPGFLVNRILGPYMAEAMVLLGEGLAPAEIDQAAVDFGMPMGPVELADSVGLDVALHVARILSPVIGRPVDTQLEARVESGRLGQKSGEGFYTYEDRKPVRPRIPPDSVEPEVQERLILAYINEAAACLADGVVTDPDLVDAGAIFGTGFAPFRGGPLHYARSEGVATVVARLERLAERHGDRFNPSPGWARVEGK
ncbi:MAG: enoyl-CoA hydratase/isomerase family protein [Chromatiales bacterium]|nr:MAG: enoyl-CoA hydratase/isomerase family protein [Chromatiales bacterium]